MIAFAKELDAWQKAAPTRTSDVIADLNTKVYCLEIESTSLKIELSLLKKELTSCKHQRQQLKHEGRRNSPRKKNESGYGAVAKRGSARPRISRQPFNDLFVA